MPFYRAIYLALLLVFSILLVFPPTRYGTLDFGDP